MHYINIGYTTSTSGISDLHHEWSGVIAYPTSACSILWISAHLEHSVRQKNQRLYLGKL